MGDNRAVAVFAANRGYALSNSRSGIIRRFIELGWRVVLATTDDEHSRGLIGCGAHLEPVSFDRGGLAVASDAAAFFSMQAIYKKWRPCLAHHFNAKPTISGTLAARRVCGDEVRIVNTITGLGHAFITGGLTSYVAGLGYRLSLPKADATVFQNSDDRQLFLSKGWLASERSRLIAGSGIDVQRFAYCDRGGRGVSAPRVLMIGRLLGQKGIPEFVEVARHVRRHFPNATFVIAGEEDSVHPDAVSSDWLHAQDGVEYVGRLSDVRPALMEADILLFPSYREGMPRVVMEAAATGLPAVGFDVPGVREAIRDGETGFLCPFKDVDALSSAVCRLLQDGTLRSEMGRNARRLAEQEFDIGSIERQHFDLYRSLGVEV